ncbi:adenylate cyclase [Desmospora sp. 8437]|nr:adenylate cyclase [Desmospora sp. 8437]
MAPTLSFQSFTFHYMRQDRDIPSAGSKENRTPVRLRRVVIKVFEEWEYVVTATREGWVSHGVILDRQNNENDM